MFKFFELKPSALSEVFSSLASATLEAERKRGDVEIDFYSSGRYDSNRTGDNYE